jgi:hypothetical protein
MAGKKAFAQGDACSTCGALGVAIVGDELFCSRCALNHGLSRIREELGYGDDYPDLPIEPEGTRYERRTAFLPRLGADASPVNSMLRARLRRSGDI